jgi:uncharacterized membrane protein
MGRVTRLWLLVPRRVRRFPLDLAGVVGLVVATGLVAALPGSRGSVLRALVGAPFVLFAPGYALTAALFPRSEPPKADATPVHEDGNPEADANSKTDANPTNSGIRSMSSDGIALPERLLFSVGASLAVVPLLGLVVNFTPWRIGFTTFTIAIGGFTVAVALYAAVRRWRVPPEARFRLPYAEWYGTVRSELFESSSRLEATANVVILASVLIAAGSGAYAVLGSHESESFTEFYILNETEGELVADDYPTTVAAGQNATFVVGIDNREGRANDYSVVVQLQRVRTDGGSAQIAETQRLDQFRIDVGTNETVHRRHTVTPRTTGERLRLQYLLYLDDPPENPTAENAYRSVHHWVNVTESSSASADVVPEITPRY